MRHIPKSVFLLFILTGCASGQMRDEQQQVSPYESYDHTRCTGYQLAPMSPEYSQCRELLRDMHDGGPQGILSGMVLDGLVRDRQRREPAAAVTDMPVLGSEYPPVMPRLGSEHPPAGVQHLPELGSETPPPARLAKVYGTGFYVAHHH